MLSLELSVGSGWEKSECVTKRLPVKSSGGYESLNSQLDAKVPSQ